MTRQQKMVQRLQEQLTGIVLWVKERVKNNPLGTLVVAGFAIWFIVTLWITHRTDRWGFDGKTFWDWMELLIVPLVLALGALWFNASQKKTELRIAGEQKKTELEVAEKARRAEREIARDRQRQATLEAYYDRMTDLLLNHGLRKTDDRDEERSIARARTLGVLRGLDSERKGQVVRFLYESGLIDITKAAVNLSGADLSGAYLSGANLVEANLVEANLVEADLSEANLSGIDLSGARLSGTHLSGTDLVEAHLEGAYLEGAYLEGARLEGAYLKGARLTWANLVEADLSEANLSRTDLAWANLWSADLSETDLRGANLVRADLGEARNWTSNQLLQAKSLENATMPDGTKYEEWIKQQRGQQPQAETDNHDVEKEEKE